MWSWFCSTVGNAILCGAAESDAEIRAGSAAGVHKSQARGGDGDSRRMSVQCRLPELLYALRARDWSCDRPNSQNGSELVEWLWVIHNAERYRAQYKVSTM